MFRKELLILGGFALGLFLAVAAIASVLVSEVRSDGKMLAEDAIPGLVNAGEALNRMSDNWFKARLLLNDETADTRSRLINEIERNSTAAAWRRYGMAIYQAEDARLFHRMEKARADFFEKRARYFEMIESGKVSNAREFFVTSLGPAFAVYRKSASEVFTFNVNAGQQRASRLIRLSNLTPYALAALCVLIFVVGTFVGFKASLGAFSQAGGGGKRGRV